MSPHRKQVIVLVLADNDDDWEVAPVAFPFDDERAAPDLLSVVADCGF